MPIYEYECKSCRARFEVKQSIADEPIATCPDCQGEVRRLIFASGIVFKGSGFYTTDHGKGKNNVGSVSEESSSKPEAKKEDSKKEEKKEPVATASGETKAKD